MLGKSFDTKVGFAGVLTCVARIKSKNDSSESCQLQEQKQNAIHICYMRNPVSVTSVVGQDHLRNFQLNGCQGNYSTSFLA
jgi:hypothetical protein